jgi:hypothetical protein
VLLPLQPLLLQLPVLQQAPACPLPQQLLLPLPLQQRQLMAAAAVAAAAAQQASVA